MQKYVLVCCCSSSACGAHILCLSVKLLAVRELVSVLKSADPRMGNFLLSICAVSRMANRSTLNPHETADIEAI